MKKLKKILVGFLALCMIMSSVRVWPAKAATEVDVTEYVLMEDLGTNWSTDTTRINLRFNDGTKNYVLDSASGSGSYIVNDNPDKNGQDPASYIYLNDKSIRWHIENYDGPLGTKNEMANDKKFNPIHMRVSNGSDTFEIGILSSYAAKGSFSLTIKAGFAWANNGGEILKVTKDVTYVYNTNSEFKKIKSTAGVDATNLLKLADAGDEYGATKLTWTVDGHSIIPERRTDSYSINSYPYANGQYNPLKYIYVNDKSMSEHIEEFSKQGQTATGGLFGSLDHNPMYLRVSTGSASVQMYIRSDYLSREDITVTLKAGFEWPNDSGKLLKVTEDVTYGYNANGELVKIEKASEIDVSDIAKMSSESDSYGATRLLLGFGDYSIKAATTASSYVVNSNTTLNGQNPLEYLYVNGKSIQEHVNGYGGAIATESYFAGTKEHSPILVRVSGGSKAFQIWVLSDYIAKDDIVLTIKAGFEWANEEGYLLKATKDIEFYCNADGTVGKVVGDVVDATDSVVVKDLGGVLGSGTTTFTVGMDGYSIVPASGDFYANDNPTKNGQDPMKYVYINGMSLRDHVRNYTGELGTVFPMTAGAIYNPVFMFVESANNYMRFTVSNSYLEAKTYDVVIKKGFSWANADGQVLKLTKDVRYFYDSNGLLCKDMSKSISVKNWIADQNLSCVYIEFADKILPAFSDAYDVMKESEAWYYLQECISIDGRSVLDINTNTDTTGWDFTVFPQTVGAPFTVPVLVQQSGNSLVLKIHENYLNTLDGVPTITINSNIYLDDITLCKIPKPITFVYNGAKWNKLGVIVPSITGWGAQSELKYTNISFGAGVLPSFAYNATVGDYAYLQEYITFNGVTVKEINETTDTSSWEFTVFPSSTDAKYRVPIILLQDGDNLTLKVHSQYLEMLGTSTYTIGIVEGLSVENGEYTYEVEDSSQFTLDGQSWKVERDITSSVEITGWNVTGDAGELIYTRVIFGENILPSIGYGVIDNNAYKYIQNYLTINGKRISDINASTDVSDYTFSTFPSTNGSPFNVPVIIFENNGVLEIKVHSKYVETLGYEDIVIGVTGGLSFSKEEGIFTVQENVSQVVAKGSTDIAEQVRVEFWVETGKAQELMYTIIDFGEGVLPGFAYGAIDGAYKYLQDYITINGKTVRDINTNVDDSKYTYSTFPSTNDGNTYKVPVMLLQEGTGITVKIHKDYVKTIEDDGITISVLKGLKIANGEQSYVVGKAIVQALRPAANDITHQITMNGWNPQSELMFTNLSFGTGVLPDFGYGAHDNEAYKYIQNYIKINGKTVAEINAETNTSGYTFTVFPSTNGVPYNVPVILFQDGNNITVKVHNMYLATLGDEITLEVAAGLRFDNSGRIFKVKQNVKFKLVSNMWQKLVVVADIDGNGDTTSTDLVRYLRWKAGEDNASIDTVFADLDTDNDNDAEDIYWVRRVLVGDDITRRSPSSLYFFSSDGSLDTFLNDFYSRHSRASVTTAIDNMQLGVGSSVWKAWETMSLVWFDNSTANFRSDGLNLIKDSLNTMPIDDYGYVWSGSDALEDPNKAPTTGTFGLGWPLPNYSGKHEGDWEFNSSRANGEETSSWKVSGGNKSQANGFLTAEATNSAGVTFETTSLLSLVSTSIASFLEVDVRWNLTGASEYKVYVSWKKSALSQNWSAEYDVTQYAVKTGTMGTQYGEHLYIPVYQISEWSGNIYGLRIIVKPVSGNITGNIDLNFVRCNYDTRQIDNMYSYVDTLKMYYEYTGDTETLEANLNRARKAVMFMQESMTDENGLIDLSKFVGHTGADRYAGRENNLPSSYWDIISMPTDSIYGQIMYYQSLQSLAWLENAAKEAGITVAAPQVKTSSTTKATYSETVDSLKQTADELATYVQNNYWDNAKGRFIDGHDASGNVVDFGSTIYNNMAVAAGMTTDAQAEQIASWLNGERAVAGDNSTGSDIYTFEFAPRVTTVDNQTQYVDGHNPPQYGASVQNGGAILFTSYYDMLARFNTAGSDDAYGRLSGIKDWYLKVLNNYDGSDPTQFYRSYYADKEITLQGAGAEGALGLDTEFIENAIVYNIVPEAFFGLGSEDGKTLQIAPQLPTELSFWRMENLVFHGVKYDVETGKNYLTLRNVSDSDSGLYVNVSLQTDKTNPSVYINGKKLSKDAYTVNDGVVTLKVEMRTQRIEIR